MSIDSISAISIDIATSAELDIFTQPSLIQTNQQIDFSDVVQNGLESVNGKLVEGTQLLEKLALGENVPTHEVMLAMTEAKMSLQMTVEVRNKLLEGYQEIMRMQL